MSKEKYDNTNKGVLFKNENKEQKNHPDYKGSFTDHDGNEYWLSAWKRISKDGETPYISIAATPKEENEDKATPTKKQQAKAKKRASKKSSEEDDFFED